MFLYVAAVGLLTKAKCPALGTRPNLALFYSVSQNKKLSYCWETVRCESMPRIAEMDVEMTT